MGQMLRSETFAFRLVGRILTLLNPAFYDSFSGLAVEWHFNTKRIILHGALAHGV